MNSPLFQWTRYGHQGDDNVKSDGQAKQEQVEELQLATELPSSLLLKLEKRGHGLSLSQAGFLEVALSTRMKSQSGNGP